MNSVAFNRCVSVYFAKLSQQVEALSSHTCTVCEQFTAIAADSDRKKFQPANFTCPGIAWGYALLIIELTFSCTLFNFNVKKGNLRWSFNERLSKHTIKSKPYTSMKFNRYAYCMGTYRY